MKEITKNSSKRKIGEDWDKSFPELNKYNLNKYYKLVGPLIMGLELIKLPKADEYRPHFAMYPLWKDSIKKCFEKPLILSEFYNKKGLQYSIPYEKHEDYFSEVLKSIDKQLSISFNGDINSKDLFKLFDLYAKKPPLSAAPNSFLQATLREERVNLAICLKDDKLIEKEIEFIKKANWDVEHFKLWDIKLNDWIQKVVELSNSKSRILNLVDQNQDDSKFEKLLRSNIIVSKNWSIF